MFGFRDEGGDDLAASYVGCRLIANHQATHLYAFDPQDFASVGPDEPGNAWQQAADEGHFDGYLHPYVQTPLWAWSLQPLCSHTGFRRFKAVFTVVTILSFAVFLGLLVFFWAPSLARPVPVALAAIALWFSEPFRYAMLLMQTHILLVVLTLAALILAERRRPLSAGLLLALAAAVKLTPAVLLVYWLLTRRWKAAASFVGCSLALVAITILTTGPQLWATYLADLHRISNTLLLSQNNQSFAATLLGALHPGDVDRLQTFSLPTAMRLGSSALMVAFTALGGWIDRLRNPLEPSSHLGVAMGLVAATLFAPIAWTHYSIILLAPILVLLHENRTLRSHLLTALTVLAAALNFRPLATNVEDMTMGPLSILRGQFFAGVILLFALALAAWLRQRPTAPRPGSRVRQSSTRERQVEAVQ